MIMKNGFIVDSHDLIDQGYQFEISLPTKVHYSLPTYDTGSHTCPFIVTYVNGLQVENDTEVTLSLKNELGVLLCSTTLTIMESIDEYVVNSSSSTTPLVFNGAEGADTSTITVIKNSVAMDTDTLENLGYSFESSLPNNVIVVIEGNQIKAKYINAFGITQQTEVTISLLGPSHNLLCSTTLNISEYAPD
jgi:hypothetical protein